MERNRAISDRSGESITVVVTCDVRPGRERDYAEWAHRVVSATTRYGATGDTILTPDAAVPTRRVLIVQFADEEGLRGWDQSEERNRLVREAGEFSSLHIQRATGLETWFTLPGERAIIPPPRWKQLLVTLVRAYPLVVLLLAFVLPWVAGWPLLLRAAVLPIVLLSLMTYVVMPQLTRILQGWLYPKRTRSDTS
jgi:antibiotic biosynthesis monooxygenase (ABM) superfamily enzyme